MQTDFFVYDHSGSAPHPILRRGSCPENLVAAQANPMASETAVVATAAHVAAFDSYQPGEDETSDNPFSYNPGTNTVLVNGALVDTGLQETQARIKMAFLRRKFLRWLEPDARVTEATRTAVADFLTAIEALPNDPAWPDWDAMTIPAEPVVTTGMERLLDLIHDPLTRANAVGTKLAIARLADSGDLSENLTVAGERLRDISERAFFRERFRSMGGAGPQIVWHDTTVYWANWEPDTQIFQNGELVVDAVGYETGTFSAEQGDIIEATKPVGLCGTRDSLLSPHMSGRLFYDYWNRTDGLKYHIYAVSARTDVTIDVGGTVTTVTALPGQFVSHDAGPYTSNQNITITADADILVARHASTDYYTLRPAANELIGYEGVILGDGGQTTVDVAGTTYKYTKWPQGSSGYRRNSGDGAGSDGEPHIPLDEMSDHYLIPHNLTDYGLVAFEPCVVKLFTNTGVLKDTHDLSAATRDIPVGVQVGSVGGGGGVLASPGSFFIGSAPFFLRLNNGEMEYVPVGVRSDLLASYRPPSLRRERLIGQRADDPAVRLDQKGTKFGANLLRAGSAMDGTIEIGTTPLWQIRDRADDPIARANTVGTKLAIAKLADSGDLPTGLKVGATRLDEIRDRANDPIARANNTSTKLLGDKVSEGTLALNRLKSGIGVNLLAESEADTTDFWKGWGSGSHTQTTFSLRAAGMHYSGVNYAVYQLYQAGADASGESNWNSHKVFRDGSSTSRYIPATPGKSYEFTVKASLHRCTGAIKMHFYDKDAKWLASATANLTAITESVNNPDEWTTYRASGVAPANTVNITVTVTKNGTLSGNNDSYLIFHQPMVCETHADATEPVPYSKAAPTILRKGNIGDSQVENAHVAAGTLLTDRVNEINFDGKYWRRGNAVGMPLEAAGLPVGGMSKTGTAGVSGHRYFISFEGKLMLTGVVTATYAATNRLEAVIAFPLGYEFVEQPMLDLEIWGDGSNIPGYDKLGTRIIHSWTRNGALYTGATIRQFRQAGQENFDASHSLKFLFRATGIWTDKF